MSRPPPGYDKPAKLPEHAERVCGCCVTEEDRVVAQVLGREPATHCKRCVAKGRRPAKKKKAPTVKRRRTWRWPSAPEPRDSR